jgi:hypothetical protein
MELFKKTLKLITPTPSRSSSPRPPSPYSFSSSPRSVNNISPRSNNQSPVNMITEHLPRKTSINNEPKIIRTIAPKVTYKKLEVGDLKNNMVVTIAMGEHDMPPKNATEAHVTIFPNNRISVGVHSVLPETAITTIWEKK